MSNNMIETQTRNISINEQFAWKQLGSIYEAVIANQSMTEANEGFAYYWVRLGNLFNKQGRLGEAVEAYQRAVDLDPNNEYLWNEIGNLHHNAGYFEDAVQAYFKAIQIDANFGWAYSNLAMTFTAQGNCREAVMLFQKSLNLLKTPGDQAITWNRLGNAYRKMNEYEHAVVAYQQADSLQPFVGTAVDRGVQVGDDLGSLECAMRVDWGDELSVAKPSALQGTAKRLAIDPANAQLWNELGNIYLHQEDYQDAIAAYAQAIRLDAQFGWPYSNLALVFARKGDYESAIRLYQKSLELIPDYPLKAVIWSRLGDVYRIRGDYANALAAYQQADLLEMDKTRLLERTPVGLFNVYQPAT